jgi:hypothetical protein
MPDPRRKEGDDPSPSRIREQLDAFRHSPWHAVTLERRVESGGWMSTGASDCHAPRFAAAHSNVTRHARAPAAGLGADSGEGFDRSA